MRPLIAQKVATPPNVEEQLGAALVIECYRIGNCAAILSRVDVSDKRSATRDFRWHLELSHSERAPTWDELEIARELLPEEEHFCLPFPRAGFRPKEGLSLHFWQIKDENLTDQWEYDSVIRRD